MINDSFEDVNLRIGAQIRAARKAAGLTQRELAQKLGVSHNKVHKLETGQTRMLVDTLVDIAAALDVSPWDLLWEAIGLPDPRAYFAAWYSVNGGETSGLEDFLDELMTAIGPILHRHRQVTISLEEYEELKALARERP